MLYFRRSIPHRKATQLGFKAANNSLDEETSRFSRDLVPFGKPIRLSAPERSPSAIRITLT